MKDIRGILKLSATDLSAHLGCHHLTQLSLRSTQGGPKRPYYNDPTLKVLREKGIEHEARYLQHLKSEGLSVTELPEHTATPDETLAAMRDGVDVVFQAALDDGRWWGRADFLLKTDGASDLGDYHYEVLDTKLARETRAGTVLQLCLYADLVGEMQGRRPDRVMVVSPGKNFEPEVFRVDHYYAYYQLVKRRLREAVEDGAAVETYPEPCAQCEICNWFMTCRKKRAEDDHLSLVAGISKVQRTELKEWGITTLTELGEAEFPEGKRPKRGTRQGLDRVQDQARVQLEGRRGKHPYHEALPVNEGEGLARLPEPSEGDVFFDIEGDAFAGDAATEGASGLEYLFGWDTIEGGKLEYHKLWAYSPAEEHKVFEQFMDAMVERRRRFPDMHIYHFAPYEPAALKRLMGRYATREDEVDDLLRNQVFVDLYAVTRQGVRCSVESYSIKKLEDFYDFERQEALPELGRQKRHFESMLEQGQGEQAPQEMRDIVQRYNEDDCVSTWALRQWLEEIRAELVAKDIDVPRPVVEVGEEEPRKERDQRIHDMRERLIVGVSPVREDRDDEKQARWLLAYMLDWHRREEKAAWWEYFRLRELADEDYLDEKAAITGLDYMKELPKVGKERRKRHRYRYPEQITEIREEAKLRDGEGETFGEVIAIDQAARTLDILKSTKRTDDHPSSIYAHNVVPGVAMEQSLMRMADWITAHVDAMNGSDTEPYRAGRDLLLNLPPRLCAGAQTDLRQPSEESLETGKRLAVQLDDGVLPIQGPPGSGKTFTGGHMIAALVKAGKRVGVTAVSHKVISNLLTSTLEAADEIDVDMHCVQKIGELSEEEAEGITECGDNATPLQMLDDGEAQVAAGTVWMWAREEYSDALDVLFVDEAGQMSLANVLAVSPCARSVVLLGDPQQLEQPQQGSHPEGTEVSALQHVLGSDETMPPERGLFLEKTWRLHPSICEYTSKLFYETRLASMVGLEQQLLEGPTRYAGAGLWVEAVEHDGNQSSSEEEVERVEKVVADLLQGGVTWTNMMGETEPLKLDDILVVAPYNTQVANLQERLPDGARVGTVDKFQGQEAPVVIYSMATSSPEEAPRGMGFLYSLNRLNVATSRAKCVCVLVVEPRLFEPECRSVRQMRLANGMCAFEDQATDPLGTTSVSSPNRAAL